MERSPAVEEGGTAVSATVARMDAPVDAARAMLVAAVKLVAPGRHSDVEALKAKASNFHREDSHLGGAARQHGTTMGNARGSKLVTNDAIHAAITWAALEPLSEPERRIRLSAALTAAQVRIPNKKLDWLIDNFKSIVQQGGPVAVLDGLEALPGRDKTSSSMRSPTSARSTRVTS
jgi:hypothetical protein